MDEREIFLAALEIDSPTQRSAYLDDVCGEGEALRERVDALLRVQADETTFLREPFVQRDDADPPSQGPGTVIGRYKLLEKIGEGGFGVVYMAEQREPVERRVALKIIKLGMDTKQVVGRFEAERQALALMEHPNIAKVFDGGATETGRPYFVMELVNGIPLTEFCDTTKLGTRQRLELFVQVCSAVQHAHQKGIIHRDLKPSNVMVTLHDDKPVPKVIDFGVAKATQHRLTEKTVFTQFQHLIGTPTYMSPEQATFSGLDIDTRSDIYSLGVVLYELLTGTTPLDAKKLQSTAYDELCRVIREDQPPMPSTRISSLGEQLQVVALNRSADPRLLPRTTRGELDWIVMKALEKDRSRRYETATALAMDIQHYLSNQPVSAGPPSVTYRLRKFVRRNRAIVVGVLVAVATLLLATIISTVGFVSAVRAKRETDGAKTDLEQQLIETRRAKTAESLARELSERNEQTARENAYAADISLAMRSLGEVRRNREVLDRYRPQGKQTDLRGWEWRYLWQHCQDQALFSFPQHSYGIWSVDISREARFLGVGTLDGIVELWDLQSRSSIALVKLNDRGASVVFSPVEDLLACVAYDGVVTVRQVPSLKSIAEFHANAQVSSLSFSPNGKLLAGFVWDDTVKLWDVQARRQVTSWPVAKTSGGFKGDVCFSPDSERFAIGETDGHLRVLKVADGTEIMNIAAHQDGITTVAFSPDGNILASGSGYVERDVKLWNIESAEHIRSLTGHKRFVEDIDFSQDGRLLASASADSTIRIWQMEENKSPPIILGGHLGPVWTLALSRDGRTVVSGGKDGLVKIWSTRPQTGKAAFRFVPAEQLAARFGARFSPDSKRIGVVNHAGQVVLLDSGTLTVVDRFTDLGDKNNALLFSPDGKQLVVTEQTGRIKVWDLVGNRLTTDFEGHDAKATPVKILDRAGILITQNLDWDSVNPLKPLRQWDVSSWSPAAAGPMVVPNAQSAAVSPDERIIAFGHVGGLVSLWDRSTGTMLVELLGHKQSVPGIDFSPDGKLLASGCEDGTTKIWDVETYTEMASVMTFGWSVSFSPDGERLVIGSQDDVQLWDLGARRKIATLIGQGSLFKASFSPDGNMIMAVSEEGHLHLWCAPSWEEIEAAEAARDQ